MFNKRTTMSGILTAGMWLGFFYLPAISQVPVYSSFGTSIPKIDLGTDAVIQNHLYLACVDRIKRQPKWVLYRVKRGDWETKNVLTRNFSTPTRYRDIALEQSDYSKSGYDLGHLYPLASVSASPYAYEVNYLIVIAAQKPDLNRGPWLKAEKVVREMSLDGDVEVIAGCLFQGEPPPMPSADEPHQVPSHTWMIAKPKEGDAVAWLMPQDAKRNDDEKAYRISPNTLKAKVSAVWWHSGDFEPSIPPDDWEPDAEPTAENGAQ